MSSPAAAPSMTHKDYEGGKLGMWLFLFTEILLFGGLFILYSAYRARYPLDFHNSGQHLNVVIGVLNTLILLTSSLTMALSIAAIQKGNRRLSMLCLASTIISTEISGSVSRLRCCASREEAGSVARGVWRPVSP